MEHNKATLQYLRFVLVVWI